MTSTHSTKQLSTSTRLKRTGVRIVGAVLVAAVLVPMSASSSSGAGTTAVAAATNDPIALAAASALDLLRGGTGTATVRSPGSVPVSSPASGSPAAGSVGDSVPATFVTSVYASPNDPQTTTVLPPTATVPPTTALVGTWVSLPARTASAADGRSEFSNVAPVSMLPTSPDVTVPVSVPPSTVLTPSGNAGSPITTVLTSRKATKKATTTTTMPVVVVAADAAPQAASGSAYDSARRTVAMLVASRLQKLSVDELDAAWSTAEPRRMMALYAALAQVGTNYRYSGNEPGGFDCSGLTSYAWSVAGVKIPRTSTDQINAVSARSPGNLLPADLVWRPGHIMMYLGAGEYIIDSPQTGKQVTVRQWGRTSRYGSPL